MVENLASSITSQLFVDSNGSQEQERLPEIVYKRGFLSEETMPELFIRQTNVETEESTMHLSAEKVLDFYQKT